jgi:hypothetical protein
MQSSGSGEDDGERPGQHVCAQCAQCETPSQAIQPRQDTSLTVICIIGCNRAVAARQPASHHHVAQH